MTRKAKTEGVIRDGPQYICHDGKEYVVMEAGYRWIQHKWSFRIDGTDSPICTGDEIQFLGSKITVTHTFRGPRGNNTGTHDAETFIEGWAR
jgi:hypothetical protein